MKISPARLSWSAATPFSKEYEDIYFNPEQGREESEYVFLQGNQLANRFAQLHKNDFVIVETGFGTGLNFLLSCNCWNSHSTGGQLHYFSVEKQPLKKTDIKKALATFPELGVFSTPLIKQYPALYTGFHTLYFSSAKVRLTLLFGDANLMLSELDTEVDAWFLDGFAPAKNPDMWNSQLFEHIGRLSHIGTTFATFTAAGFVRRGLQANGFAVKRCKGFGRKRDMLTGEYSAPPTKKIDKLPWFKRPYERTANNVVVLGGGLAGCSTAYALAQRGIKVRLIEQSATLAAAGSGNRQGALYAKLPVAPNLHGRLHLAGLLYTISWLSQLDPEYKLWSSCGVLQLAVNEKEQRRQADLLSRGHYGSDIIQAKTSGEIANLIGFANKLSGLLFPEAGWVSPVELCNLLVEQPNIEVLQHCITQIEPTESGWGLIAATGQQFECSHLVICTAEQAADYTQTEHLPLKTIRGQVSIVTLDKTAPELKMVVCGNGYVSPPKQGKLCFGATFDLKNNHSKVTIEEHQVNLANLGEVLPEMQQYIKNNSLQLEGRTALRCSTPDYLPIVGAAPDYAAFINTFARLRKDKNWCFQQPEVKLHSGLYLNTAHGSKGLITCPISAELITSMLCNKPLTLPKTLVNSLNPARFIIKGLIKGNC